MCESAPMRLFPVSLLLSLSLSFVTLNQLFETRNTHTSVQSEVNKWGKRGNNFSLCDVVSEDWDRRQGDGVTCCNNRLLFIFEQAKVLVEGKLCSRGCYVNLFILLLQGHI